MRTKNKRVKQRGMRSWKRFYTYAALIAAITSVGLFSTACSEEAATRTIQTESSSIEEGVSAAETETVEITTAPESIPPLEPDGQLLPNIAITVPEVEPMPEYIRVGDRHSAVVNLQSRLMELGFMDSDEPTDYYGTQTERAVKIFQRQI